MKIRSASLTGFSPKTHLITGERVNGVSFFRSARRDSNCLSFYWLLVLPHPVLFLRHGSSNLLCALVCAPIRRSVSPFCHRRAAAGRRMSAESQTGRSNCCASDQRTVPDPIGGAQGYSPVRFFGDSLIVQKVIPAERRPPSVGGTMSATKGSVREDAPPCLEAGCT